MKLRDAKRLHNGDEVIDKHTKETILVKDVYAPSKGSKFIIIEGIGKESGYGRWVHRSVK